MLSVSELAVTEEENGADSEPDAALMAAAEPIETDETETDETKATADE